MEPIRVQLGYGNMLVVDSHRHRGGLALLWNDHVEVEVTGYSQNHIYATVRLDVGGPVWRFTGFYGYADCQMRRESWGMLRSLAGLSNLPWLLMGDFNDILHQSEKRGRNPHPEWLLRGFRTAVTDCGLQDFPFAGNQFAWVRSPGTLDMVEEKLDRILTTDTWLMLYEGAAAQSLAVPYSDHLPILITPLVVNRVRRRRRFCFDNMWLREESCKEIVQQSWERTNGFDLLERIRVCSRDIWDWGRNYNRDFLRKIETCKAKLENLQARLNGVDYVEYARVEKELLILLEQQHLYWKQRAKEHWWRGGDLNTKFFHNSVKARRRRNIIRKLKNEDG
ncbi:PREDICTED: uncharacterized protein LOC109157277 [Ipomoea nil]|uniref:uncharacterized protein LOC109157277 n=1 Tax=Ipomoea nil TaxID=35883 RepID=UPI000900FF03|nr:PREDICTED: uncharacterized protein LOC109157277 [Ipomoea nil]